jgi:hypothetical protein
MQPTATRLCRDSSTSSRLLTGSLYPRLPTERSEARWLVGAERNVALEPARPAARASYFRALESADRGACEALAFGPDDWDAQVGRFIQYLYWHGSAAQFKTAIGGFLRNPDELYGVAVWKHTEGPTGDLVIRVAYFGVDVRFRGVRDDSGFKVSQRLFAAVELVARNDPDSAPAMPMELYCRAENTIGRRFWEGLGFVVVDTSTPKPGITYDLMIRA